MKTEKIVLWIVFPILSIFPITAFVLSGIKAYSAFNNSWLSWGVGYLIFSILFAIMSAFCYIIPKIHLESMEE